MDTVWIFYSYYDLNDSNLFKWHREMGSVTFLSITRIWMRRVCKWLERVIPALIQPFVSSSYVCENYRVLNYLIIIKFSQTLILLRHHVRYSDVCWRHNIWRRNVSYSRIWGKGACISVCCSSELNCIAFENAQIANLCANKGKIALMTKFPTPSSNIQPLGAIVRVHIRMSCLCIDENHPDTSHRMEEENTS